MALFTKYIPYEKTVTQHTSSGSTVHEHRAPTDASMQLLREMQAEARSSVIATLECRDNKFSCRAVLEHDFACFSETMRVQFTLNGERYDAQIKIPDSRQDDAPALAVKIRDALAKEIANKLCIDGLKDSWVMRRGVK
jgi:hypothetical protein